MKKAISIVLTMCLLSCVFAGCNKECDHDWLDADCTTPKTCDNCGQTQGKALGHDWTDANCTTPKTCSECGTIQGDALGHDWVDATCTDPKRCSMCDKENGKPLGHTANNWEVTSSDIVTSTIQSKMTCSVCNEIIDTKEEIMTKLYDGNLFLFSPTVFTERLNIMIDETLYATCSEYNDLCACMVYNNSALDGIILFEHGNTSIYPFQQNDACFTEIIAFCSTDKADSAVKLMIALQLTCDPTITETEAAQNVYALSKAGKLSINGITYKLTVEDNLYVFFAYPS